DIPLLADHFLAQVLSEQTMPPKGFTSGAYEELKKIHWTGNIRELRNVVERLAILCDKEISASDVLTYAQPFSSLKK
ncbi:MAG TPA: hypothetical protein VLH61_09600, partial [Bacteroidales bacterium]|nr:hypothetical protein [Bacteroidales bacterium]